MKGKKKTLSLYKAKKFDFFLWLMITVTMGYVAFIEFSGRTGESIRRYYFIAGILIAAAVITAFIELRFKSDKTDELALYDMSRAREKISKSLPFFMIACGIICFLIRGNFEVRMNKYEICLVVIIQFSLYLAVENGLFLIIHGKESKETGDDEDE